MKKYLYVILSSIIVIVILFGMCFYLLVTTSYVDSSLYILDGKTVCIDPGHGGQDPGKVGTSVNEDKINLAISEELSWMRSARSRSECSGKSKRNSRPATQNYLVDTPSSPRRWQRCWTPLMLSLIHI